MRAGNPSFIVVLSVGLPVWMSLMGCSKEVKADFPRPPATPRMAESGEPAEAEPPAEAAPPEAESPTPTPEAEPEPPPEPDEAMAKAPPEPRRPQPSPPPPATEPAPEPPSPQLAGANGGDPALLSKLRRASSLLSAIAGRALTAPQEEQYMAARGFVSQARKALNDGDERRALVLIDKGLILAEDVERTSRP